MLFCCPKHSTKLHATAKNVKKNDKSFAIFLGPGFSGNNGLALQWRCVATLLTENTSLLKVFSVAHEHQHASCVLTDCSVCCNIFSGIHGNTIVSNIIEVGTRSVVVLRALV